LALLTLSPARAAGSDTPARTPASWALLGRYCVDCHNTTDWAGGISLDAVAPDSIPEDPTMWEQVVRRLRTGMMPPPGKARPTTAMANALSEYLETRLDDEWSRHPNSGATSLHRLNRVEYGNVIRDLLHLDIDVTTLLPADDSADGFDNMADVLSVSPTLIHSYISAAMKISRSAVGDPDMTPVLTKFTAPGGASQSGYVEGAPLGTRGGMRLVFDFPLDATYEFRVNSAGGFRIGGSAGGPPPHIDVTLDGAPVAAADPRRFRIPVAAGPHTVTVAMVDQARSAGVDELYARAIPARSDVSGFTIEGPFDATGPGNTPSRSAIFICKPADQAAEGPCARRILANLASAAFRADMGTDSPAVRQLMETFAAGRKTGGFEVGVQQAIARILVDPRFLYRVETDRPDLAPGTIYRISDQELASRLSFFLWSSIPDQRLRQLAQAGQLHEPKTLQREVQRMLADPRATALTDNFAGQWLRLRELNRAEPLDRGFDDSLREAFSQETRLLFSSVLRENRSVVELLNADFTFLNQRLARHYGIDGVRGSFMRRVSLPADSPRRGLLGQGSILTVTSAGNRTSPVMRGEWILEGLLGAPVPQPPPGVIADLKESPDMSRPMSVRERMESHRANPNCAACHRIMDPLGFALENFDLIGRWRTSDGGVTIDASDKLGDGSRIDGVGDVRRLLLSHSDEFVHNVAGKLLQYALGRQLEYYDQPAVRRIVEEARPDQYSLTALIQAVVRSTPFQMRVQQPGKPGKTPDTRQAALAPARQSASE
jgi:Protein of unknown function (DUF1592)/Protein of unknown function (DUF1588)/Protein of unknown function (DUF1585)/Protein of unknown function (DUF1587)/Protein of unknown function (DUF1595)/Planctomycete cytochrome C